MKVLMSFLTVIATLIPAYAQQEQPAGPVLSVSGRGEVWADPDQATVRLGVTRQARTAQEAQQQVNQAAHRILEAVQARGIAPERIQTQDLSLYPIPDHRRPQPEQQEPVIIGYRASNVVSVRLDDLDQVGPVIDAGLAAGANQLQNVYFGLRNDVPARREALQGAVQAAAEKAGALADSLGMALGPVIEVVEEGVAVPLPTPRMMTAEAFRDSTPVSPGQLNVSASVTIRYRLNAR